MKKHQIFDLLLISFIVGIALASYALNSLDAFSVFLSAVIISVTGVFAGHYKKLRILLFVLAVFLFGVWRFNISLFECSNGDICEFWGQEIKISAKVVSEAKDKEKNNEFKISHIKILEDNREYSLKGKLIIFSSPYPKVSYGDEVLLTCQIERPEEFDGFAYDEYLARYSIYAICYYPEIVILSQGNGNIVKSSILMLKTRASYLIESGINEPESGLLNAVFLANKHKMDTDLRDSFSRSGLSHIAAISGLHIGVLVLLLGQALFAFGLRRKQVLVYSTLIIGLYIFMIGFPSSALRAGLMGFGVLLAMSIGRLSSLFRLVLFTAGALLVFNPLLLKADIGFQLSFAAVLGIAMVLGFFEGSLYSSSGIKKYLVASLVISFSAQLLTWPIIAYNFEGIPLIFFVPNLLVLWVLPILLIFSLFGIFLSTIIPSFSLVFFLPASIALNYITWVANFFSQIELFYININYLPISLILLYYSIILLIFIGIKKKMF